MTDLACAVCHTPRWYRCDPGQAADATDLLPDQAEAVCVLPTTERPAMCWCMRCDPTIKRENLR